MREEPEIIEAVVVEIEPDRNKNLEVARYIVACVVYCIIGLGIDYWFYVPDGGMTMWAAASTYAVMIFWPLVLLWEFIVIVFWAALIIGGCYIVWAVLEALYKKATRG